MLTYDSKYWGYYVFGDGFTELLLGINGVRNPIYFLFVRKSINLRR